MTEDVARLRLTVDSDGLEKSEQKLQGLAKSGGKAEQALNKTSGSGKLLTASMLGLIGGIGGVTIAVKKVVTEWLAFDKAMVEVSTIAGVTDARMKEMRKSALLLSEALGLDATEAAQGFYQALSAGVDESQVEEFMGSVGKFSQAAMTDVATATDLLTTALNSYNLEASDADAVSEKLFATIKLGKTTGEELARSFARASGAASNGDVSMSELLGTVAQLTKKGVPTAEAFTQIKAAIQALYNPSKELVGIYDQLGVSGGRQLINQRGLAGALDAVRTATDGNEMVLIKALRSSEAYNGALFLTGENLSDVNELTQDVAESTGQVNDAADKVGQLLEKRLESLKTSFLILNEELEDTLGIIETTSGAIANMGYTLQAWREFLANPDMKDFGKAFVETIKLGLTNMSMLNQRWRELGGESFAATDSVLNQFMAIGREIYKSVDAGKNLNAIAEEYSAKLKEIADTDITTPLDTIEALKKQLAIQDTLIARLGDVEQAEVRRLVALDKNYDLLKRGVITQDEWEASVLATNNAYKKTVKEAEKVRLKQTSAVELAQQEKDLIALKAKATELYRAEVDKVLSKLEDEELILLGILKIQGVLTKKEQEQLEIIEDRIAKRKEENAEAAKTPQQRAYEGLTEDLKPRQQKIREEREERDLLINQNAPDEETRELQLGRSAAIFGEDMESLEEGGDSAPKAIDLQEGINQEVEQLEQYYQDDLTRLYEHEKEKRELINESTKLTWDEKKALILKLEADTQQKEKEVQREALNQKLDATKQFFGGMSALASAFGKKGFKAAQAFAIAEATISTFQGAAKALATYPPPFSFIAAAGQIAFGLAQVAQIRSQQPPAYQQGGIVGGSSYGGDQITGRLNSGEMILNKTQQRNLFAQANNPIGKSGGGGNVTIVNNAPVQLEGEVERDDEGNYKIIVEQAVAQTKIELTNEAREGGGNFIPAMEQTFGLNRG
jgi:TP901 family phage tail tape measure protein